MIVEIKSMPSKVSICRLRSGVKLVKSSYVSSYDQSFQPGTPIKKLKEIQNAYNDTKYGNKRLNEKNSEQDEYVVVRKMENEEIRSAFEIVNEEKNYFLIDYKANNKKIRISKRIKELYIPVQKEETGTLLNLML